MTAAEAADREHAQYLADVEQAAARLIESRDLVEKEAQRAAFIAEQRKALAKLEAELAK